MTRLWINPYSAPTQPPFHSTLLGPLDLVTPPASTSLAVFLYQAKQQCRLDADLVADDVFITNLIRTAAEYCEKEIPGHRQIFQATYSQPVLGFWSGALQIPRPPCQSVVQINYYDTGGNLQVVDPSIYLVRTPWRQPGTVERAPFRWWPTVQGDRRWPVAVQFTAGYASGAIPLTVQQAILLLVSFWYFHRSGAETGSVDKETAFSVTSLLEKEYYGSYA